MLTILVEVEGVLNSRPLTYICSEDTDEPLTPSHLLLGRRLLSKPEMSEDINVADDAEELTRRSTYLRTLLRRFWQRWKSDYLSELREHHRYTCKRSSSSSPAVQLRDVVIVKEDNMKRNMWKLGKVEELAVGKDLVVRGAIIIRVSRSGKPSVLLRRPLQLVYPLEVQSQTKNTLSDAEVKFLGDTEIAKFIADSMERLQEISQYSHVVLRQTRVATLEGELRRRLSEEDELD